MNERSLQVFKRSLPPYIEVDSYVQSVLNTVAAKPELLLCTPQSIIIAATAAASFGLAVDATQEAYLVPYKKNLGSQSEPNWVSEANFQIGYRGYIKLAHENKTVKDVFAESIYSNDKFSFALGDDRYLKHEPALDNRGDLIGVYAIAYLANGAKKFVVLGKDKIQKIRERSKSSFVDKKGIKRYPIWDSYYEEMAQAKALRLLFKTIPTGRRMQLALEVDARSEAGLRYDDLVDLGQGRIAPGPGENLQIGAAPPEQVADYERRMRSSLFDLHAELRENDLTSEPLGDVETMPIAEVEALYTKLHEIYRQAFGDGG